VLLKIHVFRNVKQGRRVNSCYWCGVLQCPVRTIYQSGMRKTSCVLDPKDRGTTILRNAGNYLPHRWLWHNATNRKVTVSILKGVIGIFHWLNPSGRTMALWSTRPLTEMNTRSITWGVKAAGAYGWQSYPPCLETPEASTSWSPRGLSMTVIGFNKPKAFNLQ